MKNWQRESKNFNKISNEGINEQMIWGGGGAGVLRPLECAEKQCMAVKISLPDMT